MTSHAQAANIVVSPSSKTVNQGQTFTLNVSIDPLGTQISGAQLNLDFNKSILKINSINEGDIFKKNGKSTFFKAGTINNSSGSVKNVFGVILGPYNTSASGTFISINLTAMVSSGISVIGLSKVIISDPKGVAVPIKVVNGNISVNIPPKLVAIDNKVVDEGQTLSFNIAVTDTNRGGLSYSASNLPPGAIFNTTTRTFKWIPKFTQAGIYPNVRFEVTDGTLKDVRNISITVHDVNSAPTFTSLPANGSVFNETYVIRISIKATDLDGDNLSYKIQIDGKQVSTSSFYNWTTNYNSSGNHLINISVNDGKIVVSKIITIYINNVYPLYDVNGNGTVDKEDLMLIAQHFNETTSAPYPRYDVNKDGIVNVADFVLAAQHFGERT